MAALDLYRRGPRQVEWMKVDGSTSDISTGDALVFATVGYVKQAAAGESPIGVAMDSMDSPTADGDVSIRVDVSETSVYELEVGTGTITQAMAGVTCDIAGPRTLDVTASTDDIFKIHKVDVANNKAWGSFTFTRAGVV